MKGPYRAGVNMSGLAKSKSHVSFACFQVNLEVRYVRLGSEWIGTLGTGRANILGTLPTLVPYLTLP